MLYYNKIEPLIDDIVFVKISKTTNGGVYCKLIEYNNIEGLILNTELDRKSRDDKSIYRITDLKKFNNETIYCARVLRINNQGQPNVNVDLSYKSVNIELREELIENFGYINKIRNLCDEIVYFSSLDENTVYENTIRKLDFTNPAMPLYYDFLKMPEKFVEHLVQIYPDQSMLFVENMKSRITFTKMTVEQPFELLIYDTDAINKLRDILTYNKDNINVECVSSPIYKIISTNYSLEECNKDITECFKSLEQKTKKYKATINLKSRKNSNGKDDPDGIIKKQDIYLRKLNINQNSNEN